MDTFELAATKVDRLIARAMERANGQVSKLLSEMGSSGFAGGSPYQAKFARIVVSSAEQLRGEAIALFVELLGPGQDRQRVSGHIRRRLDAFFEAFMSLHGKRTSAPLGNWPALPQRWSELVNDVEFELDLALEKLASTTAPASPLPQPAIGPAPDVSFVADEACRVAAMVAADEAERCLSVGAFSAAVVMVGSALEAVLLDALLVDPKRTLATEAAKGKDPDLRRWHLPALIDVAAERGLLKKGADKLSEWIKDHRNLVHPGRMLREDQHVTKADASASVAVLAVVCERFH